MPLNVDFWFALPLRLRLAYWLLSMLSGLALVWWLVISPLSAAQVSLASQQSQQHLALQSQWRTLRSLSPPVGELPLPEPRAFSPLDFQESGRQLTRWQPGQGGGELVLETRWEPVAETFRQLAGCGMLIPAFSLLAGDGLLRFTLQLEHDNDR